ncbi:MAG: hypothetical protein HC824_01845 [Synechococcales cyanobacterium RM1_1_8]|nr:hypothetical protein [Synechococcales cyanobacterium RM1_1_8]
MFPFPFCTNASSPQDAYRQHQAHKLAFMKAMRNGLETRLAALNAAIASMESQQNSESQS